MKKMNTKRKIFRISNSYNNNKKMIESENKKKKSKEKGKKIKNKEES